MLKKIVNSILVLSLFVLSAKSIHAENLEIKEIQYTPAVSETKWYFAEGNTMTAGGKNFYNILAITNLGKTPKTVNLTIYSSNGSVSQHTESIPAERVKFLNMATIAPNQIFSVKANTPENIVTQKAIYWNSNGSLTGLHGSMGFIYY